MRHGDEAWQILQTPFRTLGSGSGTRNEPVTSRLGTRPGAYRAAHSLPVRQTTTTTRATSPRPGSTCATSSVSIKRPTPRALVDAMIELHQDRANPGHSGEARPPQRPRPEAARLRLRSRARGGIRSYAASSWDPLTPCLNSGRSVVPGQGRRSCCPLPGRRMRALCWCRV